MYPSITNQFSPDDETENEPKVFDITEEEISDYEDIIQQSIRELESQPIRTRPEQSDRMMRDKDKVHDVDSAAAPSLLKKTPAKPRSERKKTSRQRKTTPTGIPATASRPGLASLMKRLKKDLANDLLDTQQLIASLNQQIRTIKDEIQQSKVSLEEHQQVVQAFEAYRRRIQRQQEDFVAMAHRDYMLRLLPVLDDAEMAVKSSQRSDVDARNIVKGLLLTFDKLKQTMRALGLQEVVSAGQKFDPRVHEGMMIVKTDSIPENYVVDEMRTGYLLNGKLLRAALVSIAKPLERKRAEAADSAKVEASSATNDDPRSMELKSNSLKLDNSRE